MCKRVLARHTNRSRAALESTVVLEVSVLCAVAREKSDVSQRSVVIPKGGASTGSRLNKTTRVEGERRLLEMEYSRDAAIVAEDAV